MVTSPLQWQPGKEDLNTLMYYFFVNVRFSKTRAQRLSLPSNEDNTIPEYQKRKVLS